MQRHSFLTFMIAGLFVVAASGVVLADGTHWKSGMQGTQEMSAPNSTSSAPDSSSQSYEGPVETGRVIEAPGSVTPWREFDSSEPGQRPIVKLGGLYFREGVDTP